MAVALLMVVNGIYNFMHTCYLYLDHLRELVPEANFWTMTQGKILKKQSMADTPTIRL